MPIFHFKSNINYRVNAAVVVLIVLYILSVVVHLGILEFSGEEPRRAMTAIEMIGSGNFIFPTQYGWGYYNKPPVFNWILSFVIKLSGTSSEFVLRLPSLIFYMLMGWVHYKISKHYFPRHIAILSAFFLLTCVDVYTYGLAYGGEIDIFYSLIVYLQAISIFWFYKKENYLFLFLFSYFFCAIGFLTKGFPSIVFQVCTLTAFALLAKTVRPLFRWSHLPGLLLFLIVCAGYFFLYSKNWSPVTYLVKMLDEAFLKSAVGERASRLPDKFIIYPWLFIKMFLPWSALMLLLVKGRYSFRSNQLVWFSILFIVCNIWVYWFTGQPKIRYVYMFLPFGCTILTHIYFHNYDSNKKPIEKVFYYLGFVFLIPIAALAGLPFFEKVNLFLVIILTLSLATFLYAYYKVRVDKIWMFLAGFIILRLIYATVFIPIQRRGIYSYESLIDKVIGYTNRQPLQYYAPTDSYPLGLKTALFTYTLDSIQMPATLPLEISYYYYRKTNHIIRFDTVARNAKYFIAYEDQISSLTVDTLYAYFDKNVNRRVIFFSLKK